MTGPIAALALSAVLVATTQDRAPAEHPATALTDAESSALRQLSSLGGTTQLCRDTLPGPYAAEVEALVLRVRETGASASLLDQAFVQGYQTPLVVQQRNDAATCAVLLREDGARVQGVADRLDGIDATHPPASERIWSRQFTPGLVRLPPVLDRPAEWAFRQADVAPAWLTPPGPLYPRQANVDHAEVLMSCIGTVRSTLRACEVLHETVTDQGFGQAALNAIPAARLQPATIEGTAVEGAIVFWIRFWKPTGEDDRLMEANLRSAPVGGLAAEGEEAGLLSAAVSLCGAAGYGVDGYFGQRRMVAFERQATAAGWTRAQAMASIRAGQERERARTGITPGFSRMTTARRRQVTREALANIRNRCHELAVQYPDMITDLDAGDRRVETSLENLR